MTRYAAYVREYKTPGLEDPTLDQQRQAIEEWVAEHGGELVAVYQDVSDSDRIKDRRGLQQLRHGARRGEFDAVIVYHPRCLASKGGYVQSLRYLLLWDHGIQLFATVDSEKASMPTQIDAMLDAVVDWYSPERPVNKVDRSEWARQGLYFGRPPYGYDKDEDILIPNPNEAPIVRFIYETYATGQYSDREIANMLSQQGHRTRWGKRFYRQVVTTILTNRVYLGFVPYQPTVWKDNRRKDRKVPIQWFHGQHEPLISEELFNQCQDVQKTVAPGGGKKRRTEGPSESQTATLQANNEEEQQ